MITAIYIGVYVLIEKLLHVCFPSCGESSVVEMALTLSSYTSKLINLSTSVKENPGNLGQFFGIQKE